MTDFLEGLGITGKYEPPNDEQPNRQADPRARVPRGATHATGTGGGYQIPETGRPTIDSRGGYQGNPFNAPFSSPDAPDAPIKATGPVPQIDFANAPETPAPRKAPGPAPVPDFSSPNETGTPRRASGPAPEARFSGGPEAQQARMTGVAPQGRAADPFGPPPGEAREETATRPMPQRRPQARATGRVDTAAAYMPPRSSNRDSGSRGAVYNHYYGSVNNGTNNGVMGVGGSGGGRGGNPNGGGVRVHENPYGKANAWQKAGYLLANTSVNGTSLNDVGHKYLGRQVEFKDKNGKRIGDSRTDAHKAGLAYEAANYPAYNEYSRDAHAYRASQGVPEDINSLADREVIEGQRQGRERRRGTHAVEGKTETFHAPKK